MAGKCAVQILSHSPPHAQIVYAAEPLTTGSHKRGKEEDYQIYYRTAEMKRGSNLKQLVTPG